MHLHLIFQFLFSSFVNAIFPVQKYAVFLFTNVEDQPGPAGGLNFACLVSHWRYEAKVPNIEQKFKPCY